MIDLSGRVHYEELSSRYSFTKPGRNGEFALTFARIRAKVCEIGLPSDGPGEPDSLRIEILGEFAQLKS